VEIFRLKYESYMAEAKKEASDRFGADISKNLEEIREKHIYPWEIENNCSNEVGSSISILCDEKEISGTITNPGKIILIQIILVCSNFDFGRKPYIRKTGQNRVI